MQSVSKITPTAKNKIKFLSGNLSPFSKNNGIDRIVAKVTAPLTPDNALKNAERKLAFFCSFVRFLFPNLKIK